MCSGLASGQFHASPFSGVTIEYVSGVASSGRPRMSVTLSAGGVATLNALPRYLSNGICCAKVTA